MSLIKPHPYQEAGIKWILHRELHCKPAGGMLCDEMGLGKTIQILEAMFRNRVPKTLIVVPKSLVEQWVSEINKFVPVFKVCAYDGARRKLDEECDVCVCPYSVLVDLVDRVWNRVVLDEGHEIRNRKSLVHKMAMRIHSPTRWVLTGTPVFNRFRDFMSLCEFVGVPIRQITAFSDDLRKEIILRRVKTDMVPLEFHNVELEMYESERELYEKVHVDVFNSDCVLEGILRCRQVCAWPQMYYDGIHAKYGGERKIWKGSTAKMDSLLSMMKKHPDEKSLVFTQFIDESTEIKRRIEKNLGRNVFVLTGQTENREGVIEGFRKSPDGSVFVIQIKTGGVGLNLQEATRVYITQPSWNPATELQAIARAHRTGQTRPVIVKKLVYAECDTVDNAITELQISKSKICSRVLCGVGDETVQAQIPEIKYAKSGSNFCVKFNAEKEGDSQDSDSDS